MKKNIFLGEASYRFIRIPVNQKVFYDLHVKERAAAELLIQSIATVTVKKVHGVRKYKTDFFTDLVRNIAESGLQSSQSIYYTRQTSKPSTKMKRLSLDVLKSNIQQVLANFNQKEIYIIEHLLGSMERAVIFRRDSS
jgi:hypothetical protein